MNMSRGAADPKFHAVVDEHRRNGYFVGLDEGTPGMCVAGVAAAFGLYWMMDIIVGFAYD